MTSKKKMARVSGLLYLIMVSTQEHQDRRPGGITHAA